MNRRDLPEKYRCAEPTCPRVSEVTATWKLGKGARLPFTGGVVGQREGLRHEINLCRFHRIEAIAGGAPPHSVMTTHWERHPDKHPSLPEGATSP